MFHSSNTWQITYPRREIRLLRVQYSQKVIIIFSTASFRNQGFGYTEDRCRTMREKRTSIISPRELCLLRNQTGAKHIAETNDMMI
jgi:hypothetical protein